MSKNTQTIVISLGGSIIHPKPGVIDIAFLKEFRKLILKFLKKGFKFIIIPGGGKISRAYQTTASKIVNVSDSDKDWLGIHSIRLNAHLLITIFRNVAYPVILDNPHKPMKNHWKLLFASGWKPGWSTDYVATLLAQRFKIKEIINAGNISFVFNKDPLKYKDAKFFREISWTKYRKLIVQKWTPGLSTPFDPVASKLAQKLKIRVLVVKGTEIRNLEKAILGKKFEGSLIKS